MGTRRAVRWTAAGVLLVLLGACSRSGAPPAGPNVLLVSIDSLRWDHLGAYGCPTPVSPVLDRLARGGVVVRETISSTSWTLPAHASLLTSLYDPVHRVTYGRSLDPRRVTIAEELRAAGYRTAAFVTGPWLNRAFGLDQGFDVYENTSLLGPGDFRDGDPTRPAPRAHLASHRLETGGEIADKALQWLELQGDRPFFLFLHFWDVHYDYTPPPPLDRLFDPAYEGSLEARDYVRNRAIHAGMAARDLRHVVALYDGEIRFTDAELGRVIRRLERGGRLDETLVIVTSDHGDEFFEHGNKGHNQSLYEEVVRVPLLVRWPARLPGGRIVSQAARLIDVYPTVLDLLGLPPGREAMGRSLAPALEGEDGGRGEPAFLDLFLLREHRYQAFRSGRAKAILKIEDERTLSAVFDLEHDPGERHPRNPHPGDPLRPPLDELLRLGPLLEELGGSLPGKGGRPVALGDEERRRLRELGYLRRGE